MPIRQVKLDKFFLHNGRHWLKDSIFYFDLKITKFNSDSFDSLKVIKFENLPLDKSLLF
jgi:hypothetical protein